MAKDITVKELREKMDREDHFFLIDVREPHEHEEFNIGGNLIPMGQFPAVIDDIEEHREDEIVVYCRSGRRSASIKHMLEARGFQNVRNLEGGMLDWIDTFGKTAF